MALILSLGSNIGNKKLNLEQARKKLENLYHLDAASKIYTSKAVDYNDQPDFYNQLLQFQIPNHSPRKVLKNILAIEKSLGRQRHIPKGPRTIDIDIIFWQLKQICDHNLTIPHPRLFNRSFIVLPLRELPYYRILSKNYSFPENFDVNAKPIN